MFASRTETIGFNRGKKFYLTENNHLLDYGRVLSLWQNDQSFRSFFIDLLTQVSFTAYRWETPYLTINNLDQIFEFVLLDSPRLIKTPNSSAFADYLNSADSNNVVVFPNLGGDAILVVPSLQSSVSAYGHLAAFIREAPEAKSGARNAAKSL